MTEYEIYDLILTQRSGNVETLGVYVTIVSAYLLVAFMSGRKLNRTQALMISVMFTVAALILVAAVQNNTSEIVKLVGLIDQNSGYMPTPLPAVGRYSLAVICVAGIIAALKFMWDVRR